MSKRITDNEVLQILQDLENEEELAVGKVLVAVLRMQLDTRQFLRKIHEKINEVYGERIMPREKIYNVIPDITFKNNYFFIIMFAYFYSHLWCWFIL